MLIQGSCGLSRALGDPAKLRTYLDRGQLTQLRRRLEADAKALFALHEYGRLQGTVRLRWGFLDERFAAPWSHRDEPTVRDLLRQAHDLGVAIEAVVGAAPGWEDPWARAQRFTVERGDQPWKLTLLGDDGAIDVGDVQLARLAVAIH